MPSTNATEWAICCLYYRLAGFPIVVPPLYCAPFDDWRRIDVADNHTAATWAEGIRRLVEDEFPAAQRITLVMDNLNTHSGASLYKSFPPAQARALLDKLEFVYTAVPHRVGVIRVSGVGSGPLPG